MENCRYTSEQIEAITREEEQRLAGPVARGTFSPRKDSLPRLLPNDPATLLKMARQGDSEAHKRLGSFVFTEFTLQSYRPECQYLAPLIPAARYLLREEKKPSGPGKRGRDGACHLGRDLAILETVREVNRKYSLDHTRNRATADKDLGASACSIVAEALTRNGIPMTEGAIEAIWTKRYRTGRRISEYAERWAVRNK
jgi:hypothetical protein